MESVKESQPNNNLLTPNFYWWILLAIPYVLASVLILKHGYMSNTSSYLLDKAYLATETGHLSSIGFSYPPLPFLLLLIWPNPIWLSILTVASAGFLLTILLKKLVLTNLSRLTILLVSSSVFFSPDMLRIGTDNFPGILGIMLLVVALTNYKRYLKEKLIHHAFKSGLLLAAAFYTTNYAIFFIPVFAFFSPILDESKKLSGHLPTIVVLIFPTLASLCIWSYLSWIFTGNATFYYPINYIHSVSDPHWIFLFPIYFGVAIILATKTPLRLLIYSIPLLLVAFSVLWGGSDDVYVVVLFIIFAIVNLPCNVPSWGKWVILLAAMIQWAVVIPQFHHLVTYDDWWKIGINGQKVNHFDVDLFVSRRLSKAPSRSILTDDRQTYRLIALAGTSKPFLLPANNLFEIASNQPSLFCAYLLITNSGHSTLSRYNKKPPAGMIMDAKFNKYILYRKLDAPPLL